MVKGNFDRERFIDAFQYKLETFNEWRGTGWTTCPYYGGEVDDPSNGKTPSGWDIEILPDENFTNHVKTYEMPHTATVSVSVTVSHIELTIGLSEHCFKTDPNSEAN